MSSTDSIAADPSAKQEKPPPSTAQAVLQRLLLVRELGLVLIIAAILAFLWWRTDTFVTKDNLIIVARQASFTTIIAIGMTFVILTGGIDLSVGSVVALCSVATGYFVITADLPYAVAVPAAIATGLACGVVNALVIRFTRIPPFIVTLGMMSAARGVALGLTGGSTKTGFGEPFLWLGQGSVLGIPVPVWAALIIAVIAHVVLSRTVLGRHVYYVGSNEQAAKLSGIRVDQIKMFVYVTAASLAGLAAVLETSRLAVAQPSAGMTYELTAIGAVVIGGANLFGGSGTILGTVLGASLLTIITNGLIALNVSSYWQQAITGVVIITAVALNQLRGRRERT